MVNDIEGQIAALPIWRGRPEIAPLLGGLSNLSFRVRDGNGDYVVRIGGDVPVHNVIRGREQAVARAAHAAGFAPELVHAAAGVMVSRRIEGRSMTAADIQAQPGRLGDFLRRFHRAVRGMGPGDAPFCVFDAVRGYAAVLSRLGSLDPELEGYLHLAAALEARHKTAPDVLGHHDLMPANIIDDGERLWLIDFEYSAPGSAMFDVGNLASNAGLDAGETSALLSAYLQRPPGDNEAQAIVAMRCASLLREVLWALVSERHLNAPGADYAAYAGEARAQLRREMDAYVDRK